MLTCDDNGFLQSQSTIRTFLRPHDNDPALPASRSFHPHLRAESFLELGHVGDDAHGAPGGLEVFKGDHGVIEGFPVEGAEALVDEQGLGLSGASGDA